MSVDYQTISGIDLAPVVTIQLCACLLKNKQINNTNKVLTKQIIQQKNNPFICEQFEQKSNWDEIMMFRHFQSKNRSRENVEYLDFSDT